MSILSELNKKTGRKDRNIAQAIANLNWDKQLARLGGYSTCRKVTDFLYECWYDRIDYSMAFEFFKKTADLTLGACSAVRNGDLIGRNFDWFYNNEAEFVIHTPAIGNHYASIGVATGADIQEKDATKFVTDEKYAILPFMLVDGMNSEKVFAEINVVPAEETPNVTVPEDEALVELNGLMLVRYILDNFATAQAAVEYIRDHATVYFPKKLHAMGYEVHVMVCDQDYSYILEFSENRNIIVEPTIPISTNFPLHDVTFNDDGTVYTPETQDEEHDAIKTNGIHKYGSGLERWNTIVNAYDSLSTEDGMMSLMWDTLRYSSAYPTSLLPADPTWYTEFVGGELTCASPVEDFADILEQAGEAFTNRSRDTGKTWHTAHSAIYNLAEGTLALIAQEDYTNVYDFAVSGSSGEDEDDVVTVTFEAHIAFPSTDFIVDGCSMSVEELVSMIGSSKRVIGCLHLVTSMEAFGAYIDAWIPLQVSVGALFDEPEITAQFYDIRLTNGGAEIDETSYIIHYDFDNESWNTLGTSMNIRQVTIPTTFDVLATVSNDETTATTNRTAQQIHTAMTEGKNVVGSIKMGNAVYPAEVVATSASNVTIHASRCWITENNYIAIDNFNVTSNGNSWTFAQTDATFPIPTT